MQGQKAKPIGIVLTNFSVGLKITGLFAVTVFLFAAYGYIATPSDGRGIRVAVEWPLAYGALGFGTAAYYVAAFLLIIRWWHGKSHLGWTCLQLILLSCISVFIPGLTIYLCSTIGGSFLFSGDSGAAIFVMTQYMAFEIAATVILFPFACVIIGQLKGN